MARQAARPKEQQLDAEMLPDQLELRPLQRTILDDPHRFKVACIHRRFGKTVLAIEWLKETLLECPLPAPRGYFIFPFAKQGEEIAWDFLLAQTSDISRMKYDRWRLTAKFPGGAEIKLLGAESYNKHRGKYADAVAFDELEDIAPAAWRKVFRPLLADRIGKALFIGTPRGRTWFRDLWDNGGKLDDWASWHATVYETDSIDPVEVEALRLEMSENDFAQEFLCDWDVARSGAFYQRQINAMIADDRVCDVPHNPDEVVTTAWWLDRTGQVAISYWQRCGPMLHCIDVTGDTAATTADLVGEVLAKPYVYDRHLVPGQIESTSERLQIMRRLGLKPVRVPTPIETIDGIERVRNRLGRVRMDRENCEDLIEAGRQYHSKFDEVKRTFNIEPVRDWSATYAGSMGVYMLGLNEQRSDWSKPIEYPEVFRA